MCKEIRTYNNSKYYFLKEKQIITSEDKCTDYQRISFYLQTICCVWAKNSLFKNLYVRVISTNQKLKREVEEMTFFRFLPVIIRLQWSWQGASEVFRRRETINSEIHKFRSFFSWIAITIYALNVSFLIKFTQQINVCIEYTAMLWVFFSLKRFEKKFIN